MYEILKKILKQLIPNKLLLQNEDLFRTIISIAYIGSKYECNVCNYKLSRFIKLKNGDLLCPKCGTLSRTRSLYQILNKECHLTGKKLLHFSPPNGFSNRLKKSELLEYITTDYAGEFNANLRLDITKIAQDDKSYDIIICYHILEHIEQDEQAMKELYRILNNGGKCLIQTPFKNGTIYENPKITSAKERLKHFGQEDHVRIYSVDGLKNRLIKAGFKIEIFNFKADKDNKNGLRNEETMLIATK